MAAFKGSYEQMRALGDMYDMQMTLEGTTLIQQCLKTGDIDSFECCMDKI